MIAFYMQKLEMKVRQEDIGVAMLGKSLDMTQTLGAGMVQMMENSVTPYLGSNIDLYI